MSGPALVFWTGESVEVAAREFAATVGLPAIDASAVFSGKQKERLRFLHQAHDEPNYLAYLLEDDGLRILWVTVDDTVSIKADFHGPTVSYRRKQGGGRGQMIAKAVGLRAGVTPSVLDATAGLGRDAFVLASLGCHVDMLERVPAVRALLEDALRRAKLHAESEDPELLAILGRMHKNAGDGRTYLKELSGVLLPDVVYLDPMFPERTKSAAVKKEMQVFHELVGADPDADELLPLALEKARYRVVVKRPRIAPALAGPAPNHVLKGKSNRFDIYTKEKLPS